MSGTRVSAGKGRVVCGDDAARSSQAICNDGTIEDD